jgi:hypothetical protein
MDTKIAARMLWELVDESNLPAEHTEFGKDHLKYMILKIVNGEITDEKAHRWIGWIQGCICTGGGADLETLKKINKTA